MYSRKLAIGIGLLTILIAGYFFLEIFLAKKLNMRLNAQSTQYEIAFSEVDLSLIGRSISIDSIRIKDSTDALTVALPSLNIEAVRWIKMLRTNKLYVGAVHIPALRIDLSSKPSEIMPEGGDASTNSKSLYGRIGRLQVDSLSGQAAWNEEHPDSVQRWSLEHLELDIKSNESGEFGNRGSFLLSGIDWKMPRNLYSMSCDTIQGTLADSSLQLRGLKLNPLHPKNEFAKYKGYRVARIDLSVPEITCNGLQYSSVVDSAAVIMDKLSVRRTNCSVYQDLSMAHNKDRVKTLPHVGLRELARPLSVDTFEVEMSHFQYQTLNPKTGKIGDINFERTYMTAYNVTNIKKEVERNDQITADIQSSFLGTVPLELHYTYSLTDSRFECSGTLGALDLKETNTILIPLGILDIQSGQCHKLTFNMVCDRAKASGTVEFLYENLKVQVLKENLTEKRKLLSFLANKLAVQSDNLKKNDHFRPGNFDLNRPKYKGFWGYQWFCLQRGIIRSILPNILANRLI